MNIITEREIWKDNGFEACVDFAQEKITVTGVGAEAYTTFDGLHKLVQFLSSASAQLDGCGKG